MIMLILYALIVIAIILGIILIIIGNPKGVGDVSFVFAVLVFLFSLIPQKDAAKPDEDNQKTVVSEEKDNNTDNEESKDEKVVIKEEKTDVKKEEPEESVQEFIEAEENKILQDKEIESNNAIDSANIIEVNKTYQGKLFSDEDVDYYKFVTEKDGRVSISFDHSKIDTSNRFWNISLFDNSDSNITAFCSGGASTKEESDVVRITAGEYYIKVSRWHYYSNENYSFTVNFSEESELFEKESNNEISTANKININTNYQGNIQSNEDVDYYKFSVSEKGKVNFFFEHEKIDSSDWNWQLDLLDGVKDDTILTLYSRGSEASLKSDFARIPPGDYYLRIQKRYYSNKDYKFTVNFVGEAEQYETEGNNDIGSANSILAGAKYCGNSQSVGDVDYYSFTINEPRNIIVWFEHSIVDSSYRNWMVQLIDGVSDGNLLRMDVRGDEGVVFATAENVMPGTYYLKVTPSNYNNMDYWILVQ